MGGGGVREDHRNAIDEAAANNECIVEQVVELSADHSSCNGHSTQAGQVGTGHQFVVTRCVWCVGYCGGDYHPTTANRLVAGQGTGGVQNRLQDTCKWEGP